MTFAQISNCSSKEQLKAWLQYCDVNLIRPETERIERHWKKKRRAIHDRILKLIISR